MRHHAAFILATLVAVAGPVRSEQTVYPSNAGWVNIKTDYQAVGDGQTDDTEVIRRALSTYPRQYHTRNVIYFPDGVYLVSDTLKFLDGYWDFGTTLQGQSREGTIIRLADNAPGYGNASNPKPVVYTKAGNQSFAQYIRNLTINTGSGNAGAVAADYITSNTGAMVDVSIVSEDGAGYCGLRMERGWPGPGLIKSVLVDGFQYGIRLGTSEYSMTFENITLENQSVCGFWINGNVAAVRKLTCAGSALPVRNNGMLVLLDGQLTGNGSVPAAIVNTGFVYLRNVTAQNFTDLLDDDGVQSVTIDEYATAQPSMLFPGEGLMYRLPVKETPVYENNDTAQWVSVGDYGARSMDPLYGSFDATDGIQQALNSGKAVVFFPPNGSNGSSYQVERTVTIPATVKLITGFDAASISLNNGSDLVVNENSADPLIIERIGLSSIKNECGRTVVLKNLWLGNFKSTPGCGEVFLEDVVGQFTPDHALDMYARQFNTEMQSESQFDAINRGGKYWVLGWKTEGRAVICRTTGNGYTEILGGLVYPASSFAQGDNASAMFEAADGCIAAIVSMRSYVDRGMYPVIATESRGTDAPQVLPLSDMYWPTVFYRSACGNAAVNARFHHGSTVKTVGQQKAEANSVRYYTVDGRRTGSKRLGAAGLLVVDGMDGRSEIRFRAIR